MQILDEEAQKALILRQYNALRVDFGLNRIHLGAHLHLIRENQLWKGIAESWEAFLSGENINANAARQYMAVAKKFVYELNLDEDTLRKLSQAGITALEKAGRVINDGNKAEILSTLMSLSERDAIQRIIEISSGVEDKKPEQASMPVLRILRQYYELPPDMQSDFRRRLTGELKKRDGAAAVGGAPGPGSGQAAETADPPPTTRGFRRRTQPTA